MINAKKLFSASRHIVTAFEANFARAGVTPPWRKGAKGKLRYTIVSAVYNVDKYLDDFFVYLTLQSLPFRKHIEVIMVDDGSTDRSAEIIKRWQARYPENIHYIYKENGGQASARNLGLVRAQGEWITFLDPDDFIDRRFFQEVDKIARKKRRTPLALIVPHLLFFHEKDKSFRDNHPLNYRFKGGETYIFPATQMGDFIHLHAASALFRRDLVQKHGLYFDEKIRPAFEDAAFVAAYLLNVQPYQIAVAAKAHYYYRKRADQSSTLDNSWTKEERFYDQVVYGFFPLLEMANTNIGRIPVWLQRVLLYDLSWTIKRIVGNPSSLSFLSQYQKDRYLALLSDIFDYISEDTILKFNLSGIWFFHKVGILNLFKGRKPPFQIVYVDSVDPERNELKLRYFSNSPSENLEVYFDECRVSPVVRKTQKHNFGDRPFVYEHHQWVSLPKHGVLRVVADGMAARITINARQRMGSVPVTDILSELAQSGPKRSATVHLSVLRCLNRIQVLRNAYEGCWLFLDRDTNADDNAEHLYRFVRSKKPEINAYFILRKKSPDWRRLKKEGFRLIPFGSWRHSLALCCAKHLISSHADAYIHSYLPQRRYGDLLNYRFTFLQHGVMQHDLSVWLNPKPISLIVTSTYPEYMSMAGDGTTYKFSARDVVLAGLPRHDRLLMNSDREPSSLLIMPTWRLSLVGQAVKRGNARVIQDAFYSSRFAHAWKSLIHSPRLERIASDTGVKIVFSLHPNLEPYLDWFECPPHVRARRHSEGSFQELFCTTRLLLTDYSSTAFDVAYLDRDVIYYQFDKAEFFSSHTLEEGYFQYERDGFGPVCENEEELLASVERVLHIGAHPIYAKRRRETFPFRDGGNCQRVLDAILASDQPMGIGNSDALVSFREA